jgi:phosphoglycolate phosphatase-like HAD superfamily hydrolase
MKSVVVAFDIDGTLRSNTDDQTAAPVANEEIRSLLITLAKFKNVKILVWSGGGELYARQVVASLGLQKYVSRYADKQYTSCEEAGCTEPRGTDGTCTQHHFRTDIKPDLAIDDIQACELGAINLICRQK